MGLLQKAAAGRGESRPAPRAAGLLALTEKKKP